MFMLNLIMSCSLWFHKDRIPAGDVTVLTPLQSEMQFFSYTTNALYE